MRSLLVSQLSALAFRPNYYSTLLIDFLICCIGDRKEEDAVRLWGKGDGDLGMWGAGRFLVRRQVSGTQEDVWKRGLDRLLVISQEQSSMRDDLHLYTLQSKLQGTFI